jgi:DNA-directed RNA polymerase specialized sigma24 family protein
MLSAGPSAAGRRRSARAREADDADLVRRAQLGSAAAFEELVVRFGPPVYRFLALRLRNDSDARDALQETLSAAWQGLPSLKDPGRFRAWLLGIATHKAADSARGRTAPAGHELAPLGLDEAGILEVREALSALPAHFREVLLLRYLLRLSEHEAAVALGVRVGTVKSRSARARRALLELLA